LKGSTTAAGFGESS